MSQAKVDRYKQEKANRKENMKKEKTASRVRVAVAVVVAAVLIGWCGYSGYSMYTADAPAKTATIDYSAMAGIDSALAEVAE